MNTERIHTLLNKYWNCETSVSEEKELQDFFSEKTVPEDMEQYIPLFSYRKVQQSMQLSPDFDRKLELAMEGKSPKDKYVTIRIFAPFLRIAASVLLIAGLAVSLLFIAKQNSKPYFAETYNDPKAALQQATYALEKLSDALQLSEMASRQTLQKIDNLGFDWSSLDSLNRVIPYTTETENKENDL